MSRLRSWPAAVQVSLARPSSQRSLGRQGHPLQLEHSATTKACPGWSKPDSQSAHYNAMSRAGVQIIQGGCQSDSLSFAGFSPTSGSKVTEDSVYIWCDYICIAQECPFSLRLSSPHFGRQMVRARLVLDIRTLGQNRAEWIHQWVPK